MYISVLTSFDLHLWLCFDIDGQIGMDRNVSSSVAPSHNTVAGAVNLHGSSEIK